MILWYSSSFALASAALALAQDASTLEQQSPASTSQISSLSTVAAQMSATGVSPAASATTLATSTRATALPTSSSLVPSAQAPTNNSTAGAPRQVVDSNFADPCIWHDQPTGNWYSFATRDGSVNVQMASSPDWQTWSLDDQYDALPYVPTWGVPDSPKVWAPDIILNDDNTYVMYYAATYNESINQHCVGAATSQTLEGPYVPINTTMFCDVKAGGAIDAAGFKDSTGQRYVVYKVDGNSIGNGGLCSNTVPPIVPTPIMLQAVAGDGITLQGNAVQILDRDDSDGPLVEAPSLTRTDDGKYTLFYSSGCYLGNYTLSYAMADSIAGPYTKYGRLATDGTDGLYAPGGASIAVDAEHMVFHANVSVGDRPLYVATVDIDTASHVVKFA